MITIYRRHIAGSWTNDEFLMNLGELHRASAITAETHKTNPSQRLPGPANGICILIFQGTVINVNISQVVNYD